jgi:hypothetical protein
LYMDLSYFYILFYKIILIIKKKKRFQLFLYETPVLYIVRISAEKRKTRVANKGYEVVNQTKILRIIIYILFLFTNYYYNYIDLDQCFSH